MKSFYAALTQDVKKQEEKKVVAKLQPSPKTTPAKKSPKATALDEDEKKIDAQKPIKTTYGKWKSTELGQGLLSEEAEAREKVDPRSPAAKR